MIVNDEKRGWGCLFHFQKFVSAYYPEVTVFHNNEVLLTHLHETTPAFGYDKSRYKSRLGRGNDGDCISWRMAQQMRSELKKIYSENI